MHFIANLRRSIFAILILSRPQFGSRVIGKIKAQDCSFSPCAKRVYNWSRHYDVIKLANHGRGIRVSVRLGDWPAPLSRILTLFYGGWIRKQINQTQIASKYLPLMHPLFQRHVRSTEAILQLIEYSSSGLNALAKRLASTYTAPSGDQSHAAIITAVSLPPGLVTGFQSLIIDWVNFLCVPDLLI